MMIDLLADGQNAEGEPDLEIVGGLSWPSDTPTTIGDTGIPVEDAGDQDPFPVQPGLSGYDDRPGGLSFDPLDPATVTVDPSSAAMVGSPAADMEYWLYQGDGQGTCAPTAVAMMLADVVGVPVESSDDVVDRALALQLISRDPVSGEWSGMDAEQTAQLAESYGLDVSVRHGEIEDLEAYLAAGHAIIAGVDADEIWSPGDDDLLDNGAGQDHALVVTGIDMENQLVYLNDSGKPDGRGEVIPLSQFEDAWADSGNTMVVTDKTETDSAVDVIAVGDFDTSDSSGGLIVPMDDSADVNADTVIDAPEPSSDETSTPAIDGSEGITPILPGTSGAGSNDPAIPGIEPVESVPDGVTRVIMLSFTFMARLLDRV